VCVCGNKGSLSSLMYITSHNPSSQTSSSYEAVGLLCWDTSAP